MRVGSERRSPGAFARDEARSKSLRAVRVGKIVKRLRAAEERLAELDRVKIDLELANSRFKQADSLKSEFLASVSHELRTPLTSIRSFAEILGRYDDQPAEERRRYVGIITAETDRLTNLINDLLDLTKIEAGRAEWSMQLLDVGSVISGSAELIRPQAQERGLDFQVDSAPGVPAILGDPDRLKQVLTNLLGNAIKFTDRGGSVRLSLERLSSPTRALIQVTDTGVGIPDPQIPLIFDKFVQIRHPKRAAGGTGLGLPIVREIVEAHGGSIGVTSRPGAGSTFSVELPVAAGGSQFQSYLHWRIGYAERRGEPFTLMVIGPDPSTSGPASANALRDRIHGMVRSSDAVLEHDREGWVAVFAPVRRGEAAALAARFREHLTSAEATMLATVSFPDEARTAEALEIAIGSRLGAASV